MLVSLIALVVLIVFFVYLITLFFIPALILLINGLIFWFCGVKIHADCKSKEEQKLYLACAFLVLIFIYLNKTWHGLWTISLFLLLTVFSAGFIHFLKKNNSMKKFENYIFGNAEK